VELVRTLAGQPVMRCLDAGTAEFLQWAGRLCDLTALAPCLSADVDLVVEADDVLHGVPFAFLPLGPDGGYVHHAVRSVRTSVTVLISLLHGTTSGAATGATAVGASGEPKMGTVSWFGPEDGQRAAVARGEWWLHAGQRAVANAHKIHWQTASQHPAGCAAAIQEILADARPVRTLTVCGHGIKDSPGVALNDPDPWDGRGCDLSHVDWLLLVSCSVGRLRQGNGGASVPDVDGFVANLLARRARSALACRWPVHCMEAPWFANSVADEYIRIPATGNADRAAALARARDRFLRNATRSACVIGLNTLAAFELYGEG
jgi:hypothetical protein